MPNPGKLTPEQVAKVEEMLKAGAKVSEIVNTTGAKDYQVNFIKRRLGLVKPRPKAQKPDEKKAAPAPQKKSGELSINDIRSRLEAAQREVARWQQRLVERVAEVEKMIAAIKKS